MPPLQGLNSRPISTITGQPELTSPEVMEKYQKFYDRVPGFLQGLGTTAAEFAPGSGEYLSAERALSFGKEAEKDIAEGHFADGLMKYLEAFPETVGTIPGVSAGMMVGKKSLKASKSLLKKAMQGYSKGKSRRKIRETTGWFKSPMDGQWRFEISDRNIKLTDGSPGFYETDLQDAVSHDKLFESYPELKDTTVDINISPKLDEANGSFLNEGLGDRGVPHIIINARNAREAEDLFLHEIQHNVQYIEGFARGGSWTEFPKGKAPKNVKKAIGRVRNKITDRIEARTKVLQDLGMTRTMANLEAAAQIKREEKPLIKYLGQLEDTAESAKKDKPFSQYRSMAGEIEARDTAARREFDDTSRSIVEPEFDKNAILRYHNN